MWGGNHLETMWWPDPISAPQARSEQVLKTLATGASLTQDMLCSHFLLSQVVYPGFIHCFFLLAVTHGLRDLSSLTRDQTPATTVKAPGPNQ